MTAGAKPTPSADATLALLGERIRRQGDLPGFAKAINSILGAMRGEDEREFSMTQTVLSDPILTQKVLRLANSGMYSAFGQRISTVSKAVLVLGTEAIGHLALGIKLIEELGKSSPDSVVAHAEMEKAMLAGMVAQEVSAGATPREREEAVVCSMLHALGRMMVAFYLPERWAALEAHGGAGNEDGAAFAVLGLSMERIGRASAEQWGLPASLISGMRVVLPDSAAAGEALSRADWLAALSTLSSQCAEALWHDDDAGAERVRELADGFAPMLGIAPDRMLLALDKARLRAAADLSIAPLSRPAEKRTHAVSTARQRAAGHKLLASGVADMRGALTNASPAQMVSMALETIFKGLSFSRSVAFLRDRRHKKYVAKLGFGEGATELLPHMTFDEAYEPDVFHAALGSDRVIFIENARDPKFASKLPGWWKAALPDARAFVVIPICSNGQPNGFLYGDWDDSFPAVLVSQAEFGLLNELRALLVQSIERRQQLDLAASRT